MAIEVRVQASSEVLRFSLVRQLEAGGGLDVEAGGPAAPGRARIIVVPVADCSPPECREFIDAGAAVIILAAIPSDRQRDTYLHAGAAAYVAMTPGTPDLLDAVSAAAACLQPLLAD
jgi:hypothetical protein